MSPVGRMVGAFPQAVVSRCGCAVRLLWLRVLRRLLGE